MPQCGHCGEIADNLKDHSCSALINSVPGDVLARIGRELPLTDRAALRMASRRFYTVRPGEYTAMNKCAECGRLYPRGQYHRCNLPLLSAAASKADDILEVIIDPPAEEFGRLVIFITVRMASGEAVYKLNVSHKKHVVESYASLSDGYTPKAAPTNTMCRVSQQQFAGCFLEYARKLRDRILEGGVNIDLTSPECVMYCGYGVYIASDVKKLGGDVHCTPCIPLGHVSPTCVSLDMTQFGQFIRIMRFLWGSGQTVSVIGRSIRTDRKMQSEFDAVRDMLIKKGIENEAWFLTLTTELERRALKRKLGDGAKNEMTDERSVATDSAYKPHWTWSAEEEKSVPTGK